MIILFISFLLGVKASRLLQELPTITYRTDPNSLGLCVNQQRTLTLPNAGSKEECAQSAKDNDDCSIKFLYEPRSGLCDCVPADDSYAEKVYYGGEIYTFDESNTKVEALVVRNGNIEFVGSNTEALGHALVTDTTEQIDLEGKFVLPGFIDPHSHFTSVGLQQSFANVLPSPDGTSDTFDLLVENLNKWADDNADLVEELGFIFGMGYDEALIADGKPNRFVLDRVRTDIPVLMTHISMHGMVMNSKALEFFGYNTTRKAVEGGKIGRLNTTAEIDAERENGNPDFEGEPSGVLEENEIRPAFFHVGGMMYTRRAEMVYTAMESYASYGYTTVQEGMWMSDWVDLLIDMGEKDLYYMDTIAFVDAFQGYNASYLDACQPSTSNHYINKFRCGGAKITFDGSPQMKTAWTRDPYLNPPADEDQDKDWFGFAQKTDEDALHWVSTALADGHQLLVHVNGDRAVQQLIEAVIAATDNEGLFDENGEKTNMIVGIHNQIVGYDQVLEYDRLGIFPAIFPMHTFYWGDWHMNETFGDPRASVISRSADFLDTVGYFTSHHDAPVGGPDAWRVLSATITRRTRDNKVLGQNETVSVEDGVRSTTDWAALQYHEDHFKGTLEVGKMADMVVMDKDIFAVDLNDEWVRDIIADMRLDVLYTIKQGNVIWSNADKGADPMKYDLYDCGVYQSCDVMDLSSMGRLLSRPYNEARYDKVGRRAVEIIQSKDENDYHPDALDAMYNIRRFWKHKEPSEFYWNKMINNYNKALETGCAYSDVGVVANIEV